MRDVICAATSKEIRLGTTGQSWPIFDLGETSVWEYAALVTSLDSEILTLGQLYRDRADAENMFDELKNQWGWGGFTTQDLTRCRLLQLVEPVRPLG